MPRVRLRKPLSNRVRSRTLILDRGEYKTTNHRENPNCSRSRLGTVLKKFVLPPAEEFQRRVEEHAETVDFSMEEVTQLVQDARSDDR